MKRFHSILISIVVLMTALSGCATSDASLPNSAENAAVNIYPVEAKALQETTQQYPEASQVAKGANDFAFQLSAALARENGDDNFICSPYSVWLPLAALVNATDSRYKAQMLDALNAAGIDEADLNNAASRMLYDLTKEGDKAVAKKYGEEYYYNPLKIANAIFVGNNVTLKKEFAQTFMDYYRGTVMNVDFQSQSAIDAVNKWAAENTDGLITDIVQEFAPDAVAAIANAIYFSDRWAWEFNPDRTTEDTFYAPAGETTAFYMLREGIGQLYYEDDQIQAMPLSFSTGGGMYIILPKDESAPDLLTSMTSEYFDEIQNNLTDRAGKLLLPRFSIESGAMNLKDTLTALGIPLFDETAAPLTGGLLEEDVAVWLSGAVQKAIIQVDEKGTTAAAVTVMMAAGAPAPDPSEPFEMICNKPFVFILYGKTYDGGNQILFTGIVNQP